MLPKEKKRCQNRRLAFGGIISGLVAQDSLFSLFHVLLNHIEFRIRIVRCELVLSADRGFTVRNAQTFLLKFASLQHQVGDGRAVKSFLCIEWVQSTGRYDIAL